MPKMETISRHTARAEASAEASTDSEIRLLRIFRSVAECGGFAAAERELGIGRSAVSRHMKELEARLGVRLCRRGRAGFALSDDGAEVYRGALQLLQEIDGFRARVQDLRTALGGTLHAGIFDKTVTNPRAHVGAAVRAFRQAAPAVTLDLTVDTIQGIEAGLISGRFQVGVLPSHRQSEMLEYQPLFDEDMFLYCGQRHPLFAGAAEEPAPADLRGFDYAGLAFHSPNMEASHAFGLRRQATANDQEAIATLVLSGMFIAFLPDHYAQGFVDEGKMRRIEHPDCRYKVHFVAAWRRSPQPTRVVRAFLQALQNAHARRARGQA
jgi:DNA-binding transcriptional LysR family regulator